MTLDRASESKTGVWRKGSHPSSILEGDMTDKGYPNAYLELDIYKGGSGVLRTEYGWYPVIHFQSTLNKLRFDLNATHEVKPDALDRKIIQEAANILSKERAWNRHDNRKCRADAAKWSIYCALEKATIDVTGGFHHRRPALEVVRKIVQERTMNRHYHHRLMDYNNDPKTHLSDVQSIFRQALRQMEGDAQ